MAEELSGDGAKQLSRAAGNLNGPVSTLALGDSAAEDQDSTIQRAVLRARCFPEEGAEMQNRVSSRAGQLAGSRAGLVSTGLSALQSLHCGLSYTPPARGLLEQGDAASYFS